jgi:hypothetical protein
MSHQSTDRDPKDNLSALEQRLASWRPTPAAGGVDRDRMLFEAGRAAAGGRSGWFASACLALLALGLGGLLARERGNRRDLEAALAARVDAPPGPSPAAAVAPPARTVALAPDSYLVLTQRMLAAGIEDPTLRASNPAPGHPLVHPEPALSPLDARRLGGSLDL